MLAIDMRSRMLRWRRSILFDADRLDLMRVGITPDPERMATERGAYYARNINEFCVAERR